MSFVYSNLKPGASHVPNIWSYTTLTDTTTSVRKRDYFEEAKSLFRYGDWIFVTASDGGIILHVNEIDPLEINPLRV